MNTTFVHEDFLLESDEARTLFHDFAEPLPIIDYHCHLPPREIAENRQFANLTQIWLNGDHYKWRAMRTCGVQEHFITGNASDWEKFEKWAETVPKTIRNPLYHWTHLELKRPFGIADRLLSRETARAIWEECNAMLATPEFSTRGILKQMNVEALCTTDDPTDRLEFHEMIAADGSHPTKVYPAFRADNAMSTEEPKSFVRYTGKLAEAAGMDIRTYDDFCDALSRRHEFFHSRGCRLSDHGLETACAESYTEADTRTAFTTLMRENPLPRADALKFKSAVLYDLALMDHKSGWVQQFHLGALRNTNSRMMQTLGPNTGFDSIGDFEMARPLAKFLDRLDAGNMLPKTILYNINPRDNHLIASMTGNFQDGSVPGKVQYGSAWWFLDNLDGMTAQIEALSNLGLLSQFVGMLTDSRSFLSYPRHEYFRRLLCNILGHDMERGRIPRDINLVGGMVKDICYGNARRYFNFPVTTKSHPPSRSAGVAAAREGT